MLKIGVLGIGNCGNQVALLANEKLKCPAIAINSSDSDLSMVKSESILKIKIEKEAGDDGTAKDRDKAKKYLKASIMDIVSTNEQFINTLKDLDVCFIVASTGGGTGSGTSLILSKILEQQFPKIRFVLVAITPVMDDKLVSHTNTLQFFNEMREHLPNATYMVYDNDRYAGISSYKILNKVNEEIVADLEVLRGSYNYNTRFDAIDREELKKLVSYPGRLLVVRTMNIKDKDLDKASIEDIIIGNIKSNAHAETQRNKKITAMGVITNLSETMMDTFDDNLPAVSEFVGSADFPFKHIYINEDKGMDNNVFILFAGLSSIEDKLSKIIDRTEELRDIRVREKEESVLDSIDTKAICDDMKSGDAKEEDQEMQKVDVQGVFNEFGIE